ncbi:MAG: DUF4080 domain-containing protein [Clostridia bacterium]
MKILLTTLNSKYVHTNLALKYIYKVLEKISNVSIKEYTINMQIDNIVMDITENSYDLIAFSVYIWNVEYTLKVCNILKQICPETKIVLGGPEVTYSSEKILKENAQIDYVMLGEGEEVYPSFIKELEDGKVTNKHISRREGDKIFVGEVAKIIDTEKIPRVAKMLADEYDGKLVYFETSRGCPFRCSYCLSSLEKTVRPFDITRVKEELKILLDKDVRVIKFVDRTFNYSKERALEIWKYIIENRKSTICHFEIAAHILDLETIEFLKTVDEHAIQFEIGVQSTNPKTIDAIDRATSFEKIASSVNMLKGAKNIHFHLDLIAGLPYEGYESFRNSFDEVFKLRPECLQLGFLKLLHGCKITNERDLHEYKYVPYPPYEVISTKYISYAELKKLKKIEMVLDVYNNSEVFKNTMNYILDNTASVFDFFESIAMYYDGKEYFKKSIGLEDAFDYLYNYATENKVFKDLEIFKEYLKLDFNLKFNSKRFWFEEDNSSIELKKYIDVILKNEKVLENKLKDYASLSRPEKLKVLKFVPFIYNVLEKKSENCIVVIDKKKGKYVCKFSR